MLDPVRLLSEVGDLDDFFLSLRNLLLFCLKSATHLVRFSL